MFKKRLAQWISYPLSAIHYLIYGILLLVFHPIQWVCIHWIGKKAHQRVVSFLNLILIKVLLLTGNKVRFSFEEDLPQNTPLIFVANHQSVYDIPPLIWYLRMYSPKFVGKKELGRFMPSVSINLKHNGSVLIDRNDSEKAVSALVEFAKTLQKDRAAGVIFPEGTRSRNGVMKPFKSKGLLSMIENMPDAWVVPISINHSWRVLPCGVFPLGLGNILDFTVHSPISVKVFSPEEILKRSEQVIKNHILN